MASTSKAAWRNPSYLQSSFGIFMFFCSWGIWWSFFSRWLLDPNKGLGMTQAEQGSIYSINSLATLLIMFAYGAIQDQLGIKRKLVIVISAIAACVGPFVNFVYAPMLSAGGATRYIGVLIGSVVLSAGFMAGCSLIEALTERYSRKFGFEYGQSRAWVVPESMRKCDSVRSWHGYQFASMRLSSSHGQARSKVRNIPGTRGCDKGLRTFSWRLSERIFVCPVLRNGSVRWNCISRRR